MLRRLLGIGSAVLLTVGVAVVAHTADANEESALGCDARFKGRAAVPRQVRDCTPEDVVLLCGNSRVINGERQPNRPWFSSNPFVNETCEFEVLRPQGGAPDEIARTEGHFDPANASIVSTDVANCPPNVNENMKHEFTFERTTTKVEGSTVLRQSGVSVQAGVPLGNIFSAAFSGAIMRHSADVTLAFEAFSATDKTTQPVPAGTVTNFEFTPKVLEIRGQWILRNLDGKLVWRQDDHAAIPIVLPSGMPDGILRPVIKPCEEGAPPTPAPEPEPENPPSPSPVPENPPSPSPVPEDPPVGGGGEQIEMGEGTSLDGALADGRSKCMDRGFVGGEQVGDVVEFEEPETGRTLFRMAVSCSSAV